MSVNEKMTAIADAIREKTGGTEPMGLDAMAEAVRGLEVGGGALTIGNVDLHNRDTDVLNTFINGTNGKETSYNNYASTDYIRLTPGKLYALVTNGSMNAYEAAYYDGDKQYIAKVSTGSIGASSSNIFLFILALGEYVRFSMPTASKNGFSMYECEGNIIRTNDIVTMSLDDEVSAREFTEALREMGVNV